MEISRLLKLEKEYTYSEICDSLGWTVTGGCSKVAQIKELERCFEFYHPLNKKTNKSKKSYVFTKQLSKPDLIMSTKRNRGNRKNIRPIIELIQTCRKLEMNTSYTYNYLYYKVFKIINTNCTNLVYNKDKLLDFCEEKNIDVDLFYKYVAISMSYLKKDFDTAFESMSKSGLLFYQKGYSFGVSLRDSKYQEKFKVFNQGDVDKIKDYEYIEQMSNDNKSSYVILGSALRNKENIIQALRKDIEFSLKYPSVKKVSTYQQRISFSSVVFIKHFHTKKQLVLEVQTNLKKKIRNKLKKSDLKKEKTLSKIEKLLFCDFFEP